MLKIEGVVLPSQEQIFYVAKGMRNSYNSQAYSDTKACIPDGVPYGFSPDIYGFGPKDKELALKLIAAGSSDRKFLRMLPIIFEISAPLYFWKEADTYKIGTVRNSSSTMHKLMAKPFESSDFSTDIATEEDWIKTVKDHTLDYYIRFLNVLRDLYLKEEDPVKKKEYWRLAVQNLPSSYNQYSTVSMNYEVLRTIYHQRKDHRLSEWHTFCKFISDLPMSEFIV